MENIKEPITPKLRAMLIGETLTYPIGRSNTIRKIIWTNMLKERSEGMRFSCNNDIEKKIVIVTRIA